MQRKTIYLFGLPTREPLFALNYGLRHMGHMVRFVNTKRFDPAQDVYGDAWFVIVYGAREKATLVRESYNAAGIPVFIVDAGYFLRPDYHQISLNGLNWLPEVVSVDAHNRAESLGMIAEPPAKGGDGTLLLGQVDGDAQHDIQDCEAWLRVKAEQYPDAVIRRHPKVEKPPVPLSEAIRGKALVVTHNSTAALEAIRQGVRVECDDSAFYAAYAKEPNTKKRQELFDRACQVVWTEGEMKSGVAIKTSMENAGLIARAGLPPVEAAKAKTNGPKT